MEGFTVERWIEAPRAKVARTCGFRGKAATDGDFSARKDDRPHSHSCDMTNMQVYFCGYSRERYGVESLLRRCRAQTSISH